MVMLIMMVGDGDVDDGGCGGDVGVVGAVGVVGVVGRTRFSRLPFLLVFTFVSRLCIVPYASALLFFFHALLLLCFSSVLIRL